MELYFIIIHNLIEIKPRIVIISTAVVIFDTNTNFSIVHIVFLLTWSVKLGSMK